MNWTEISVAVGVASVIFGWLKMDNVRLMNQVLELEKKLIAVETKIKFILKDWEK